MFTEQLARERTRSMLEEAERLRYARRLRILRRASRLEHRAERRMAGAWRRAAELRGALESACLGTGGDVLVDLQAALEWPRPVRRRTGLWRSGRRRSADHDRGSLR